MSARPGKHSLAPARAARPWRGYWQLAPVALLMYALVAVDRFRHGAQAAGLVNAVTINRLSRPIGGSGSRASGQLPPGSPAALPPVTK
jgi:hypothetical protein